VDQTLVVELSWLSVVVLVLVFGYKYRDGWALASDLYSTLNQASAYLVGLVVSYLPELSSRSEGVSSGG
jgi:hypothetical protein